MSNNVETILQKVVKDNTKNKVFLCIGTTKCVGDSLGPRVGEILSKKIKKSNVYVIGNIKNNISYKKIYNALYKIYNNIEKPYLILIDSALSNKEYVGNIVVNKNSMIIGNALNKTDYKFGKIFIKGIVGENKKDSIKNFNILNNVSINLIEKLSKDISNQIIKSLYV